MLGMALLIGIGVEFVRVEDDIGRMNTLFKLYLEGWVLFGVASAFALWHLASRGDLLRLPSPGRAAWLGLLTLLLLACSIYPVLGTKGRLMDRFKPLPLTLDGAAYMKEAVYDDERGPIELRWDQEAIRWLQANVKGSPVVLEGVTTQYRWGSRISIYTGLPTLVGWPWHQMQQRGNTYMVEGRQRVVREIYSTASEARALELLREYGVEYVVVGKLERLYYPEAGLAKFERMVGRGLTLEYENPGVRIYRVRR
jgi:uncharacterized membrane protein